MHDYPILKAMFDADVLHQRFQPQAGGGFDFDDMRVLDEVLRQLVTELDLLRQRGTQLAVIEVARPDYATALAHLSPALRSSGSAALFLDAPVELCLERIHQRTLHPQTADDHPSFPDEKFRHLYKDSPAYQAYLRQGFHHEFPNVATQCIDTSSCSRQELCQQVEQFVQHLISTPVTTRQHNKGSRLL